MQQDTSSRSEIEKYEAQLTRDPESYVFARLSQAYLEAGLIDNAFNTAWQGVNRHPRYIAGQRALARACHAKGMDEQCRQALETVTAALPEELDSQKMLVRLLVSNGQASQAILVLRTILDFYPDEEQCRAELAALEVGIAGSSPYGDTMDAEFGAFEEEYEDEEIIEDIEILDMDDSDILDDHLENYENPASPANIHYDPLSTATLAELYVQQGFYDKALTIYRAMSTRDERIKSRIEELEAREAAALSGIVGITTPAAEEGKHDFSAPVSCAADNALAILEGWLDNVRRIKACR